MSSVVTTLVFIQQKLIHYVCSAYLIFGLIGSCLNIILLTRRQFRTTSCCMYFVMASITVLIGLPVSVVPFIYSLYHANPYTTISAFCKIRTYLIQVTIMLYRWCLVAACFDRYALTSSDPQFRNFATVRIAYRVIIMLIVIWLLLPIYIFFFFDVRRGGCHVSNNIAISLFNSIYTFTFGNILPVIIMTICALLINRNLAHKRKRSSHLIYRRSKTEDSIRRRDHQTFAMLLIQVLVFMITQTPRMIYFIYNAATIMVLNKSIDRIAIERFINFTTDMIVILHPVLSFYLYTLASRTFRNELRKLLHFQVHYKHPNVTNLINSSVVTSRAGRMNTRLSQPIAAT